MGRSGKNHSVVSEPVNYLTSFIPPPPKKKKTGKEVAGTSRKVLEITEQKNMTVPAKGS